VQESNRAPFSTVKERILFGETVDDYKVVNAKELWCNVDEMFDMLEDNLKRRGAIEAVKIVETVRSAVYDEFLSFVDAAPSPSKGPEAAKTVEKKKFPSIDIAEIFQKDKLQKPLFPGTPENSEGPLDLDTEQDALTSMPARQSANEMITEKKKKKKRKRKNLKKTESNSPISTGKRKREISGTPKEKKARENLGKGEWRFFVMEPVNFVDVKKKVEKGEIRKYRLTRLKQRLGLEINELFLKWFNRSQMGFPGGKEKVEKSSLTTFNEKDPLYKLRQLSMQAPKNWISQNVSRIRDHEAKLIQDDNGTYEWILLSSEEKKQLKKKKKTSKSMKKKSIGSN